ncbi:hypothetical protein [Planomicrobium okeanokoites]|uniref:hypothetical protein n=1 Tax=Planomicrobium okeanokoites TaxID=244 RepID=UPI000A07B716|nr:hypothetical protein [Planomicrobium okeanokoites]
MDKVKIHSLTLTALLFSSISMAFFAGRNFSAGETGYGMVFVLLCMFMLGLVLYGFVRNRRLGDGGTEGS